MYSHKFGALLVTFLLTEIALVTGKKGDSSGYKTTYECEGKTLNLICNEGIIRLIRANYGRFSISICNDHGNLDWRVNCMSRHSFLIMQERCNLKPNCSVNVSSTTFHDPCPGTLKYLEVQYHCGTGTPLITIPTTTPLPTPKSTSSSNVTGVPNIGKIQTATYRAALSSVLPTLPSTSLLKTSTSSNPVLPTVPSFNGKSIIIREYSSSTKTPTVPTTLESTSSSSTTSTRTSTLSTTTYSSEEYCSPTVSRGIHWAWTKSGETAMSKCPDGASGTAKWACKNSPARWSPEIPDLLECHSLWLENLRERLQNGDSIISITSELAVMSSAKLLFSEDLKIVSSLIQQALYKSVNSMENFLDTWHRYHVLRELLQSSVQTLSNILENKQESAWKDLKLNEKKAVISTLVERLDESALLLAETSSDDGSFSLVKSNVWLSLQVLKSKNQRSIKFPSFSEISSEDEGMYWMNMQDSVMLPQEAVEEYAKNGFYKVVFCVFNKLNEYLVPGTTISHHLPEHSSENITRIINSRIIGASLDKTGNVKLNQPVVITLKHLIEGNVTNPVCVYWDFHLRDWSAQGCWMESNNKSHTVCLCDHLTNFALVMDLQSDINLAHDTNLMHLVITIGCIIAIISLLLTLLILFMLSLDLSEDSTFIHRNMFLCLLLSEIVYLGGIKQTSNQIACSLIAGSLQYLFLVTFSWMFFECFHQYMTLIRSCEAKKSKSWWYYAVSYIMPALITGISAIIDPASYGTNYYCWLQADNYFVFSFVGPAISILFGGSVFLCIALCMFYHNISNTTAIKGKDSSNLEKYRSWNKRSIFLIILLTLTWTSAFVYINGESMALACTFSVLNSIQGISILCLYCFQNEKVKDDVRKVLRHDFCFKQRKQQEPQITNDVITNGNTSGDCDPQQFWGLPKEKMSSSPNSVPEPSANAPSQSSLGEEDARSPNAFWMVRGNSNWKPAFYAGKNGVEEQDTVSLNLRRYQASNPKDHSHQFFVTPESNGQFLDHIYETIDDDTLPDEDDGKKCFQASQRFPPPENYYGDHSDLSQHSSSSCGYDQQPLIVLGLQNGSNVSQKHFTVPRDSHIDPSDSAKQYWERNQNQSLRRQRSPSDKTAFRKASDENASHFRSEKKMHGLKGSSEVWEPPLPDLLQSPSDSTVVLAVLDGDKVVNRIQPEDVIIKPQYKLSTYC